MPACTPAPPSGSASTHPLAQTAEPHFSARQHEAEYAGPGREIPAPGSIDEVRIGYFGPADAGHATAGAMWMAATMAVEEANRDGGYEGKPFRLLPTWSENPWGTGVRGVIRLVYEEGVWAIIGAPDGPSAHLVEQVVAKARVPFISPVATDKTTNLANVPWIFSCAPGDHLLAPLLAEAMTARSDQGDLALVTCTDHDSRMFTTELLGALHGRQTFPSLRLEFRPGLTDFATQLETLRHEQPAAIALVAGPADSARAVCAIRQAGLTQPIYGGPAMGHRLFVEAAGAAAEGAVFPLLWDPATSGESADGFTRRFVKRYGFDPD
jgi:ABC-type branched-subunit amino acid transport system substrate-binding protein